MVDAVIPSDNVIMQGNIFTSIPPADLWLILGFCGVCGAFCSLPHLLCLALPVRFPVAFCLFGVGISPVLCILVHCIPVGSAPVSVILPDGLTVFLSPFTHIFPACLFCCICQNKSFLSIRLVNQSTNNQQPRTFKTFIFL